MGGMLQNYSGELMAIVKENDAMMRMKKDNRLLRPLNTLDGRDVI